MSDICEHGDLSVLCIDCTVAPPDPKASPPVACDYEFIAQFDGHCDECDLPVAVGMRIDHMTDGTYRHHGCVAVRDAP